MNVLIHNTPHLVSDGWNSLTPFVPQDLVEDSSLFRKEFLLRLLSETSLLCVPESFFSSNGSENQTIGRRISTKSISSMHTNAGAFASGIKSWNWRLSSYVCSDSAHRVVGSWFDWYQLLGRIYSTKFYRDITYKR